MNVGAPPTQAGGWEISSVLASDLAELALALTGNASDLPEAANIVCRDFKLAVRSFLAVTFVAGSDAGPPVTLTLSDGPVAAQDVTSAFSLCLDRDVASRLTLTCYSGGETLAELAGDLASSLDLLESDVDLHAPLPQHDLVPGLYGLDRFRAAHESAGVRRAAG